jgi:hypothetical protein
MNNQKGGQIGLQLVENMGDITQARINDLGLANAKENQQYLQYGQSLKKLRNARLGDDDSALVIAAGPSMKRMDVAGLIKQSGFQGAIIAADSAMLYCLRNGIIPDLVVTLDPHGERIMRWFGNPNLCHEDLQRDDYFARQDLDTAFADQMRVNEEIMTLLHKYGKQLRIALSTSAAPQVVKRAIDIGMDIYWWNPMYDDPDALNSVTAKLFSLNKLPCVNAGGNVGSACWMMAHAVLGKQHVGLTGMDFSYYAETPYKNTQYYYEAIDLVGEKNLDDIFVHIYNPHLEKWFYTDPAYLWYRNCFLEMANEADCVTYNCTQGGILFGDNIIFAPLQDFLTGKATDLSADNLVHTG